ncbi:MAG TPA: biotin/lipoyl-containing protein [Thermoanaerobaculia bacterium]
MTGVKLESGGQAHEVSFGDGFAAIDGTNVSFTEIRRDGALVALEIDGAVIPVRTARRGDRAFVWCAGQVFEVRRAPARAVGKSRAAPESHAGLVAPMPGRIRKTLALPGEAVVRGQVVLVLEAMKMEHAIRAPKDGVITKLEHREGDLVEAGEMLAEIG